jgi:UDP-N-acetylmuramyl tripeptide synthase
MPLDSNRGSVCRLLETVRDTGPRRILTVFGAEGHGDASQRPVLGEVLHYKAGPSLLTCLWTDA